MKMNFVTDFEIIRDKIVSIRLAFTGDSDHQSQLIELALWNAQLRMEDAILHAHNDQGEI